MNSTAHRKRKGLGGPAQLLEPIARPPKGNGTSKKKGAGEKPIFLQKSSKKWQKLNDLIWKFKLSV